MLLYLRVHKSPVACSSTYEHVSHHARMLLYSRASTHALAHMLLYIRTRKSQCAQVFFAYQYVGLHTSLVFYIRSS
ncbi:hypothetical protein HanXRQr2_Chr14g0625771 [Helianthus annuus]|uniref:Uncharacterized protein n=1 Tax=Helianthus annuus TaxID=4232 RepID=A0A9K3E630_HELAN|nr:hypothetical protein HanXRQr2_Chr14g0625771 [Helianthus annuus]KAJ0838927.1 hypothetical protein HanPSC8_Chr14g0600561 [Helianthus annuus]